MLVASLATYNCELLEDLFIFMNSSFNYKTHKTVKLQRQEPTNSSRGGEPTNSSRGGVDHLLQQIAPEEE